MDDETKFNHLVDLEMEQQRKNVKQMKLDYDEKKQKELEKELKTGKKAK